MPSVMIQTSFSLFVHLLAARLASRLSIRRRTPRTQVLSTQALVTRQSSAVLAIQLQSAQRAEKETLHPNTDQRANEALHISTMTTLYMAAAPSGSHPVWPPGQKETTAENTCSLESIMPMLRTTTDVRYGCSVLQPGHQPRTSGKHGT